MANMYAFKLTLLFLCLVVILMCVLIFSPLEFTWSGFANKRFAGSPVRAAVPVKLRTQRTGLKSRNSSVVIIYWTKVFHTVPSVDVDEKKWPFFYAGSNCPVNCVLSTNKSRVDEASAIVVHARNANEAPEHTGRVSEIPWILHTNENPVFTSSLKDAKFMAKFNYLASYRLDSDFPCPGFHKPSLDRPVPFANKALVVMIYSHCENARTSYIRELMKHIKVDSYGGCLHNKDGLSGRYSAGSFEAALEMQRKYKFVLVFPNADCDYYITEKIYNALSAGSVPVWLGTDKVDDFLKWGNLKHSIIKVKDFASPKKLAEFLLQLSGNEKEYNRYLKWKYEGFKFPREYYSSAVGQWWDGLPLYCRVCMKLLEDPKGHNGLPVDRCDGEQTRTLRKWWPSQSTVINMVES